MSINVIVALDFDNQSEALSLVEKLNPSKCALKVGSEMFMRFGGDFIRILMSKGFNVFLDLKFYDISNTVSRACIAAAELGIWMFTLHASGGFKMMEAARAAIESYGEKRPLIVAVTVLTSMSESELAPLDIKITLQEHVCNLATLAKRAGLDGVVSSALDVPLIKAHCGPDFLTITPGIRRLSDKTDDQSRIVTPEMAYQLGSDYLVVGRPITSDLNPTIALNYFLKA